jgi:putative transposase
VQTPDIEGERTDEQDCHLEDEIMRIARQLQLPDKSAFHYMWRCINGEMFMRSAGMKEMFLDSFFRFFKRARGKVLVFSFCVMSNHFHMAAELLAKSKYLSLWARAGNSSFAQKVNRILKRRGPVGQDRPKTVVAEDAEALKRVMFYHDWNPVEAQIVDHPREYKYSSYNYYANGEQSRWTKHITEPQWYRNLADTPEGRQAAYRDLSDAYWADKQARLEKRAADEGYGIGSEKFVANRTRLMKSMKRLQRRRVYPRKELTRMAATLTEVDCSAASPQGSPGAPIKIPPGTAD